VRWMTWPALFLLLSRMRRAKILGLVRGSTRQTGSAHLASPISGQLFVGNRRFLSEFRAPGETRLAKLAPPIWLSEGRSAHS